METIIICKHFNELTTIELYRILQLRLEVFSLEQNCMYQDCDDRDLLCYHLLFWQDDVLVAYSRLLPKGVAYENYCSIGRVLTKKTVRGTLLGKQLVQKSIQLCNELFNEPIKIGAQSYLEKFYSDFGFVSINHHYLEDDIPHMSMVLKNQ
ncbi:MAG: GNAT family N-acetyltransferase [Bacteroidetes bacterium]|nr:GNAT family N-acetyltransferase [Bacteroidota bacterium]